MTLMLPAQPRLNLRPNGAVGADVGSLVKVYSPGEIWTQIPGSTHFGDWEVRPRSGWAVGLAVDDASLADAQLERRAPDVVPFRLRNGSPEQRVEGAPIMVWLPAAKIPDWQLVSNSAADPPVLNDRTAHVKHLRPFVPYGSARIRLAEFPRLVPVVTTDRDA